MKKTIEVESTGTLSAATKEGFHVALYGTTMDKAARPVKMELTVAQLRRALVTAEWHMNHPSTTTEEN